MVAVKGQLDLHKLAKEFKDAARRGLGQKLDKAMIDAGEAVGHGIRDASDIYMPRGYEQVFAKSLVIKTELGRRGGTRTVGLTVRAFGRRGNPRQVEKLEKGMLKHPVFTRKVWVWQKVRPGFVSEPVKFGTPAAVRKLDRAVSGLTQKLNNVT